MPLPVHAAFVRVLDNRPAHDGDDVAIGFS
jgi:hypothetical protein